MNRLKSLLLLIVLTLGTVAAAPAPAAAQIHASVNVSFFYDSLAPYGQWLNNPSYGYVWRPTRVSTGWRPYMNGRWLYTDAGFAFDSYEPWGWATFHYGRWMFDPYYGWIWVPGTEWSPAWVDFQVGDGLIGWAALPPGVNVSASFGGGFRSRIDPRGYCFVEDQRFLDSRVDRYVTPWDRNSRYLRDSRGATRFTSYGGMVVNRGLPVTTVERSVRRAVRRVPIVDVNSYTQIASRRDRGFAVYRPNVRARADHRPAVVYPPVAQRRVPVESRSGRLRTPAPAYRPPAQPLSSRVTSGRRVVEPRRVLVPQRRVTPPPAVSRAAQSVLHRRDVRPPRVQAKPQRQVVTRQVVRRQVTTERRTVTPSRSVGSRQVDRRPMQRSIVQRSMVQRSVAQRSMAQRSVAQRSMAQRQHVQRPQPQRQRPPAQPKKQHGKGRPNGG